MKNDIFVKHINSADSVALIAAARNAGYDFIGMLRGADVQRAIDTFHELQRGRARLVWLFTHNDITGRREILMTYDACARSYPQHRNFKYTTHADALQLFK